MAKKNKKPAPNPRDKRGGGPAGSPGAGGGEPPDAFDEVDDFFFGADVGAFERDEYEYDPFIDGPQGSAGAAAAAAAAAAGAGGSSGAAGAANPDVLKTRMEMQVDRQALLQQSQQLGPGPGPRTRGRMAAVREEQVPPESRSTGRRRTVRGDGLPAGATTSDRIPSVKGPATGPVSGRGGRKSVPAETSPPPPPGPATAPAAGASAAAPAPTPPAPAPAAPAAAAPAPVSDAAAGLPELSASALSAVGPRTAEPATRSMDPVEPPAAAAAPAPAASRPGAEGAASRRSAPGDRPARPEREASVPIGNRRAAGAALAASMEMEAQVFVGDEEDEGTAIESQPQLRAVTPAEEEPTSPPSPAAPRRPSAPVTAPREVLAGTAPIVASTAASPPVPSSSALAAAPLSAPEAGEWSLAVTELTAETEALSTKKLAEQRAALLFEVGRIVAWKLGDSPGAEARFEAAIQAHPRFVPALRELVRLCASRGEWARAVDLLARQENASSDPAGQTAALLASAHIQLSQLDRLPEAAACLDSALQSAPDNYIALRFQREIRYRSQEWTALVGVLRRALSLAGPGERMRIQYELGRLHDEVLKAPSEAVDAFRACLQIDGRFIPTFLAAERLLQESGDVAGLLELWRNAGAAWGGSDASFWLARAARAGDGASLPADQVDADWRNAIAAAAAPEVLSEEYRHWLEARGRWDRLAAACEDALEGEQNPRTRAALLCLLGRICLQQQGNSAQALERFTEALAADPRCVDAQEGKRQILASLGEWDKLLDHLAACGETASEPRAKLAQNLKMAEVAMHKLEDLHAARLHLEAACSLAPNYLPAVDALIHVAGRLGEFGAQAERLEQAAGLVDSAEARSCYFLRASRAWERAGRVDRSVGALQRATSEGPGVLLAREWLVEAFVDDGRWAEAAEALRHAAAETEDPALKVSLLYRAGRLALSVGKDEDAAEAVYRSLLDLVPDFLPATMDLRDMYAARGDWDAYGLLQQQEAEGRNAGGARAWWHLSAGAAYERSGRVQDAIAQYKEALRMDPADPVANAALRRVYRSTADHGALAQVYAQQIRGTQDRATADALRVQLVAALHAVGDAGATATEVAELLKSEFPDELPLAAVGILCEGMQCWDQAIAVYSAVGARKGADPAVRAACLFQEALLCEEVREDAPSAVQLYERAAGLAPAHSMALEGLERVYAQQGDTAALAAVYSREARLADTQPVRTFYALLAGEQHENHGQANEAIECYRLALQDPVGRERAWDALRRLAVQSRDSEVLSAIAATLGSDASDEAIARGMELGDAFAGIGDEGGAASAFARVLSARPEFLPAAYHLERLQTDREDWNGVLSALQAITQHARSESVRKDVEARIQRILEERGVTSDSAFEFYARLLDREPKNPVALRGLGGIHLHRKQFDEAKGCFERLMELDADAPTRAEAAANLGRVAMESGADPAEATRQLERAIELHPQHRGALQALRELHTRTGNWNSLVGVLAREASIAPEDRRLPWYVEIAKVWQDHIGNARVAVSSWQKVLQEDPQHAEAIERLLQLYEKQGDWKGYLDTADRGIGKLSGFALRERQAELGAVAQEKAHDVERAVAYYRAATSGDLPVPKALEALRRVARSRGDWESVISLSEQEVEIAPDAASKVALLEEAARIKLDQLLDRDGAAGLFRRALALDPQCGSALSFFVNYLFDNESWEEALPVFRNYEPMIERMDIEGDDDARIEATAYYYKFGAVLGKAGEEGDALRRFARALELTPTHLPSLESAAPRWFEAGDWTRAAETYRQILKLRGGTGDAAALTQLYLRLGQAELRVGDPQNAIKRFKKALDQTPNHVEALQGIAQIHRLGEDWNSLLSTYNSIIKYARDPDQVIEAYMTKGDVLEQKLQFTDKAVLHYEKVLMYDKSNVAAMTRLGEIALRRGESGRAVDLGAQAARAAQVTDEKIQGLLLERIAQGGDQIDVQGVLEAVRHAAGDGDALAAFRVAAGGREQLDRMEAASAYREAFRTL